MAKKLRRGDVVVIGNCWPKVYALSPEHRERLFGEIGVVADIYPKIASAKIVLDDVYGRSYTAEGLSYMALEVIDHDEDLLKEPEYHSQQMRDEMDEQGTVMSFNDEFVRPPSIDPVFDYQHPHFIYPDNLNRDQIERTVLRDANSFFGGGQVLLAIDASGSTDIDKLKHQLLQYENAIKKLRTVSFDMAVLDNGIYKSVVDSIQCPRGGTDINCVLLAAKAMGYKNVLMFSDGMFAIPGELLGIKIAVINPINQIARIDQSWAGCTPRFDPKETIERFSDPKQDKIDTTQAILKWLSGHDTGSSSIAIALRALGLNNNPVEGWAFPYDNDDFGRCHRLLKKTGININIMKDVSPVWNKLVRIWEVLTKMYEAEVQMYSIIMLLLDLLPAEDGGLNQTITKKEIR
jgi:hypothetical protein